MLLLRQMNDWNAKKTLQNEHRHATQMARRYSYIETVGDMKKKRVPLIPFAEIAPRWSERLQSDDNR